MASVSRDWETDAFLFRACVVPRWDTGARLAGKTRRVHLVYPLSLVQPNKRDKPNKPDEQNKPDEPDQPVLLVSRVPPVSPVLESAELSCKKFTGRLHVVRDIGL